MGSGWRGTGAALLKEWDVFLVDFGWRGCYKSFPFDDLSGC